MTKITQLVKLRGKSAATASPPVGPTHGNDREWKRLRAWLVASAVLDLVATLAMTWWAKTAGREAALSSGWPIAVGTLGTVWISGVVHGRRVILLTFLLGYIMLPISLAGEPMVWRVVGYALFVGGQVWNLAGLCRATPLPTSKALNPRKG